MSIRPSKSDLIAMAVLLALSSLASINLLGLPAFEDEGTEMRWIWRVLTAGEWLHPLQYGRPLEIWPMVPLVRWGLHPLTTMRGLHVFAGMIATLLIYQTARAVGNRRRALICGALFAVCPFVVYLQRVALADMYLCVTGLGVLLCAIRFLERQNWRRTVLLAISLVLPVFAKAPVGFVFLISVPLALLFMPHAERLSLLRPPARARLLIAYVPSALLVLAVMVVAVVQLRRGHEPGFGLGYFWQVAGSSYDLAAIVGVPPLNLLDELVAQLSMPVVIFGAIGVVAVMMSGPWLPRWLAVMGALPMLGIGLLAKIWFSRYLLFTLPPLIISAVWGWSWLLSRMGKLQPFAAAAILAPCVAVMGYHSALIICDPLAARWSPLDRFQYVTGWTSGYGFPEAAQFVRSSPDVPPMIYALDGHSAFQLLSYLPPAWAGRVRPIGYAQDGRVLSSPEERLNFLISQTPTWIIIPEQVLDTYLELTFGKPNPDALDWQRVAQFNKPESRVQLVIYKVTHRTPPAALP